MDRRIDSTEWPDGLKMDRQVKTGQNGLASHSGLKRTSRSKIAREAKRVKTDRRLDSTEWPNRLQRTGKRKRVKMDRRAEVG